MSLQNALIPNMPTQNDLCRIHYQFTMVIPYMPSLICQMCEKTRMPLPFFLGQRTWASSRARLAAMIACACGRAHDMASMARTTRCMGDMGGCGA
jgi:hypothetical protein